MLVKGKIFDSTRGIPPEAGLMVLSTSPLCPEAVKKFRVRGNEKGKHVQGAAKIFWPKEAMISSLGAVQLAQAEAG